MMMDIRPRPSTGGGPCQGMAMMPSHKAPTGIEQISSSLTYLPGTSWVKPSSKLINHHFMAVPLYLSCLAARLEK